MQVAGVSNFAGSRVDGIQVSGVSNIASDTVAGAQIGVLLPFSRKHESEADEIGLYLTAMAGYNPEAAAPFWTRMNKLGGARPPEFLSTHPDPVGRSARLKQLVPKARAYARKYPVPASSKVPG